MYTRYFNESPLTGPPVPDIIGIHVTLRHPSRAVPTGVVYMLEGSFHWSGACLAVHLIGAATC